MFFNPRDPEWYWITVWALWSEIEESRTRSWRHQGFPEEESWNREELCQEFRCSGEADVQQTQGKIILKSIIKIFPMLSGCDHREWS